MGKSRSRGKKTKCPTDVPIHQQKPNQSELTETTTEQQKSDVNISQKPFKPYWNKSGKQLDSTNTNTSLSENSTPCVSETTFKSSSSVEASNTSFNKKRDFGSRRSEPLQHSSQKNDFECGTRHQASSSRSDDVSFQLNSFTCVFNYIFDFT